MIGGLLLRVGRKHLAGLNCLKQGVMQVSRDAVSLLHSLVKPDPHSGGLARVGRPAPQGAGLACCSFFYYSGHHSHICKSPRRNAIVTACVRSLAWSFSMMFLMWKLTVVPQIARLEAICLFRRPSRTSNRISASRRVSDSLPMNSATFV